MFVAGLESGKISLSISVPFSPNPEWTVLHPSALRPTLSQCTATGLKWQPPTLPFPFCSSGILSTSSAMCSGRSSWAANTIREQDLKGWKRGTELGKGSFGQVCTGYFEFRDICFVLRGYRRYPIFYTHCCSLSQWIVIQHKSHHKTCCE